MVVDHGRLTVAPMPRSAKRTVERQIDPLLSTDLTTYVPGNEVAPESYANIFWDALRRGVIKSALAPPWFAHLDPARSEPLRFPALQGRWLPRVTVCLLQIVAADMLDIQTRSQTPLFNSATAFSGVLSRKISPTSLLRTS